jgi:ABC-type antimicrobial peptide transport system permease subunit
VGALGAIGLLLAAVGLYGLMAFLVGHRTREIGIRMALGALPRNIFRLMLGRALWLTGIGVAVGCAAALAATRALATLLYGVTPRDSLSFAVAIAVLLAVGVVATLLPARRAARLDPMQALRHE